MYKILSKVLWRKEGEREEEKKIRCRKKDWKEIDRMVK